MLITVFAKKCQSSEGKTFYKFLATLTNTKTGEDLPVQVKFREAAGNPDPRKCPMNITFDKKAANLAKREYTREDTGEIKTAHTLWVMEWQEGPAYVDTSLDDYE